MVATTAAFAGIAPADVGNNGPSERPKCWQTSERWSNRVHAGHKAASKHRAPPGKHPQTQVCVRDVPRPRGSVLDM
eukprot:3321408-Alexandrium_andersonii.AAC.1